MMRGVGDVGKSAKEVVDQVRDIIGSSDCDEKELYELLLSDAEGWRMRLDELDDESPGGST
jgi:hypothetical protein